MWEKVIEMMNTVKTTRPLVHHITNYVTVNDCANITLCAGGSPVMTDAKEEIDEMVSFASAVVLNIGTLNHRTVDAMLQAGKAANSRNIPVILDPVGAGATRYRTETVWNILDKIDIAVIKGNEGEIGTLSGIGGKVEGVDSKGISGNIMDAAESLASKTGAIVAATGKIDTVSDGKETFTIENGHDLMGMVSGTGCMASSVVGCYNGCSGDVIATISALAVFSIAGEMAALDAKGPGSFKTKLMDSMYNITGPDIRSRMKIKQR